MKSFQIIQRTMPDGQIIAVPRAIIKGIKPGPTLAIVAGVHGCEFCGIEAVIRLFRDLNPEEISGTVRMAMCANLPAFMSRTMYVCPIDGGQVSPPGSPTGTYSKRVGNMIWEEVIGDAEYYLDLHGGDLIEDLTQYVGYNTTGDKKHDEKAKAFAYAFGAQNIQVTPLSPKRADALEGKVKLLVEAGSQGRRDEEDVLFQYEGILNLMRHLGMLPGSPPPPRKDVRIMDDFFHVKAGTEGIFYPMVEPNDIVEKGQVLCEIRDWTGKILEVIKSPGRAVNLGTITAQSTFVGSTVFGLGRLKE